MLEMPLPTSLEWLCPESEDLVDSLELYWRMLASKGHQAVITAARQALKSLDNSEEKDAHKRKTEAYLAWKNAAQPHGFLEFNASEDYEAELATALTLSALEGAWVPAQAEAEVGAEPTGEEDPEGGAEEPMTRGREQADGGSSSSAGEEDGSGDGQPGPEGSSRKRPAAGGAEQSGKRHKAETPSRPMSHTA